MFKVALVGASGLLGRAIAAALAAQAGWRVIPTAFRRASADCVALDIRNAPAVERFIAEQAPDAVVIAAAERRPDICEREPEFAHALNVDAVRVLAAAARRCGAWVLSISTDYVFDGRHPPYRPGDRPAPLNAYGRSKLDGERALLETTERGCVLRLPLLYGPVTGWHESAVTSLVPVLAAADGARGTEASMDAWAIRYPTYTPDVAFIVKQLLERQAAGKPLCGIAHWSGDEAMTKYDIALHLARELGFAARITSRHTPTDDTPRPHDCHLDSSLLEALGMGRRTPFGEGIRQVLMQHPWRAASPTDGTASV